MNGTASIRRVRRTKQEAKASYDRMSRWYDVLTGSAERKYKEMGLRQLNTRQGEAVLEIGYGTGECLKALARSVSSAGRVYGIDLSEGMTRLARQKLRNSGAPAVVHLACGDAAKLPYKDNVCDAIFSSFTLELFDTPEIPVVLGEWRRVLRADGRICIVAMAKKERSGWMVRLYEWAQSRYTKTIDCRPIYVWQALEEAGFQMEGATEAMMFGLPVDIVLAKK